MKFHYAGKFNGDVDSLPKREHPEGAVMFKEPTDMKKFALYMNIFAIVLLFGLIAITKLVVGEFYFDMVGCFIAIICMIPHEYLHAICFKEDVYMYENLKMGMLFVVGTEEMTKMRYIVMCLCPFFILGVIPYVIYLFNPSLTALGAIGVISIASCAGDLYNTYNAITQMPKGAKTYIYGMNSYWYIPKEDVVEEK